MPAHSETSLATAVRAAIDLRRFPWIRPLVAEYATNFERVSQLFTGNPASPADWASTIARVQHAQRDPAAIERIVSAQLERRGAPPEARASASLLADPRTVAIVTGQQAGLFGGPLYTLLKAVTAIQLARQVQRDHGTPAVPVFWVDAEDHDWEEVRSATVLDANLATRVVTLADLDGAGAQPVASLVLDEGINDALGELEDLLPATEFTAEDDGAAAPAVPSGRTLHGRLRGPDRRAARAARSGRVRGRRSRGQTARGGPVRPRARAHPDARPGSRWRRATAWRSSGTRRRSSPTRKASRSSFSMARAGAPSSGPTAISGWRHEAARRRSPPRRRGASRTVQPERRAASARPGSPVSDDLLRGRTERAGLPGPARRGLPRVRHRSPAALLAIDRHTDRFGLRQVPRPLPCPARSPARP